MPLILAGQSHPRADHRCQHRGRGRRNPHRPRLWPSSLLTMLENLGGPEERITSTIAVDFDLEAASAISTCSPSIASPAPMRLLLPPVPGLPDEAFLSDGQLTKREIRAATLAKLAPMPGALLWDVGAGCGSVAIEWLRAARDAGADRLRARRRARCAMIAGNARRPRRADPRASSPAKPRRPSPASPTPDAIFLGGERWRRRLFARLLGGAETRRPPRRQCRHHRRRSTRFTPARPAMAASSSASRPRPSRQVGDHSVMRPRMAVTQWRVIKPAQWRRRTPMTGTLHLVGVGPGDPELLTLKAVRMLGAAAVIAYPTTGEDAALALSIAEAHLNPAAAPAPRRHPHAARARPRRRPPTTPPPRRSSRTSPPAATSPGSARAIRCSTAPPCT